MVGFSAAGTSGTAATFKNLDKALGRLVSAGFDNLSVRAEVRASEIKAQSDARIDVIRKTGALLGKKLDHDDELAKRALGYTFGESILKQDNREKIARLAAEKIVKSSESATADAPTEIDSDWLNKFSDVAGEKSNEQIQQLWASILAGKIRQPSSFSLQSLQLLSALDTNDANLIHEILNLSIARTFVFKKPDDTDISRFIMAEDLGVLSGTSGLLNRSFRRQEFDNGAQKLPLPTLIDMISYQLLIETNAASIEIPCYNLTRFGIELLSFTENITRNRDYDDAFIKFLKTNSSKISKITTSNGQTIVEDV